MDSTFSLLDLPSQAIVVQRLLKGRNDEDRVEWLSSHGTVTRGPVSGAKQVYRFVSLAGLECTFFFDHDRFVFVGDHTTYTVDEQ